MNVRARLLPALLLSACVVFPAAASAQETPGAAPLAAPTPAPAPTPPPNIDVRMIRLKISAGDLPSAESILEYHRAEHGEDGDYTMGVAWVAQAHFLALQVLER